MTFPPSAPPSPPENIVVAVNGSAGSESALDWAIARANAIGSVLQLVAVIEFGTPTMVDPDHLRPAYERHLLESVDRARAAGVTASSVVVRGFTSHEIVRAAVDADLLVIGTREPAGYFSGTLRHRIAGESKCPVVVVPAGWIPRDGAIVVGVDDDESSVVAVEFAASEATRSGRPIEMVHAWQLTIPLALGWLGSGADPYEQIKEAHQAALDVAVAALRDAHPDLDVIPLLGHGSGAQVITENAESAELVVVGTHRRGLATSMLLGSVAHDLLISMPAPIVIVPHVDLV